MLFASPISSACPMIGTLRSHCLAPAFTVPLPRRTDHWQTTPESPGRTLSEFVTHGTESFRRPLRALAAQLAHRLLGSRHMIASLSMRRSVLSMEGRQQPGRRVMTWLGEYMEPLMAVLGVDRLAGAGQVRLTAVAGWSRSSIECMPVC